MSSRGRPPKNGTPFDRLLKKQCQKGVSASKSAGVVGKWGSASFTSLRSAPLSSGSESVARPKKFFKSKNTSSSLDNDFEPIIQPTSTAPPAPTNVVVKPPSRFFKSKTAPTPVSAPPPAPLRPLEVTPNQALPPQPAKKQPSEDMLKVPPLKLRLKAGALVQQPPVSKPPVVEEKAEEEDDEEDYTPSGSEDEDDHEISFKEPSLVIKSPEQKAKIASPPQPQSPIRSRVEETKPVSPPVRSPSPPRVTRTSRVVPETKPIETPLVTEEPAPVKPSNNGALRSYTRKQTVAPSTTSEQEPVVKKIKVEEEVKSLPQVKASASEPKSSSSFKEPETKVGLIKSASVPTSEMLVMPPPSSTDIKPKKSIFKSRSTGGSNGSSGSQRKAMYKHSFGASQEKDDELRQKVFHKAITNTDFDDDFGEGPSPSEMSFNKLTRVTSKAASSNPDESTMEVVSVKIPKVQKEYFTVIKNVKKAHQIQDSGEFQEFNDDVEYIMDGLQPRNNLPTRCLSTVTLATKCMEPPFRMHLRAHGTMNKFFAELKDAPQNPSLALCTATVLFVLSQDRLNMDMDRDSLELMLNLLDTDSRIKDALDGSGMSKKELEKNKLKVQELCGAMKAKGHAANLSLENISADHLSMETLLSLTSKRAGEWFKEELRELGGLDHLVRTMSDCLNFLMADEISMWTEPLHNKLTKAGRVLKVLESVTHENEENCQYLLEYQSGKFLDLIHKFFKFLDEEVPLNPNRDINDKESVSFTLRESLFDVMRVYINLVHDYNETPIGSKMSGEKADTFDLVLHCLFVMPNYLPVEKRFDGLVLTLTLLINLVEHCEPNRETLLKTLIPQTNEDLFSPSASERKNAAEGLVQMFLEKEENAKREESKTDAILDEVKDDPKNKKDQKTEQEVIDETVAKLLQKAGRHMEDTFIASYVTLIIGYLIKDSKEHEAQFRELLPDKNFSLMTAVLKKFYNFMNLTASSTVASNRGIKATEMVLKYLEKVDQPEVEVKKEEENFDDITLFDVTKDESSISLQQPPNMSSNFDLDDDFDKL